MAMSRKPTKNLKSDDITDMYFFNTGFWLYGEKNARNDYRVINNTPEWTKMINYLWKQRIKNKIPINLIIDKEELINSIKNYNNK